MASIGEMMDAVAHQWKQPLNALSMYGELMKSDFNEGLVDKVYVEDMLAGVNTQIEHMITTLGEFRNFFRPNSEVVAFNLLEVINSVLLLVKDEFMKNTINIEVKIDEKLSLKGNENEFKHLILNLINNAKDAFKENKIKNRRIIIEAYFEKSNLILSVQDSAGGISEAVIDSLFEANVTTKAKGKGTGIGLYMSAQIVEKMQGKIWVENKNEGACFKIKLPL
jgi:signal transduction histidine kinase